MIEGFQDNGDQRGRQQLIADEVLIAITRSILKNRNQPLDFHSYSAFYCENDDFERCDNLKHMLSSKDYLRPLTQFPRIKFTEFMPVHGTYLKSGK